VVDRYRAETARSTLTARVIDGRELFAGERNVRQRAEVFFDLTPTAGADEDAGDIGFGEEPGDGHLGEGLTAALRSQSCLLGLVGGLQFLMLARLCRLHITTRAVILALR